MRPAKLRMSSCKTAKRELEERILSETTPLYCLCIIYMNEMCLALDSPSQHIVQEWLLIAFPFALKVS